MLEKYCDILVIGRELPGLVTAAFLARRGLSVQVIDSDLFMDHPKLPDPVCLCNINSKLLRSILGRLNCPEVTMQNFLGKDSVLQFIFPQNRIDVYNDPLKYFDEIEREFPEHKNIIKYFYEQQAKLRHQTDVNELFQQLIPQGWKQKRLFKKFIKEQSLNEINQDYQALIKLEPRLKSYLMAQYLLTYQQFSENPFSYQVSELFNPADGEIFSVHAGVQAFKRLLEERITQYDGLFKKDVPINKLLFRSGIFEGVETSDGNVLSKYVIWNSSLPKLAEFLPRKFRFRGLRKTCQSFKYDFHWFTARFTVESQYIPKPMKPNVVLVHDFNRELFDDNFLYLQLHGKKAEPLTTINVNFLLPPSALQEDEDFFIPYLDSFKAQLIKLIPFSEKSLKLVFPTRNTQQPMDTLFPLNENDFEIFKHSAKQNGVRIQNHKSFTDLFKLHYRTKAPNFYVSHPAIFSSFGIESKLILGLKITDLIWNEAEKDKKRSMKQERRIA